MERRSCRVSGRRQQVRNGDHGGGEKAGRRRRIASDNGGLRFTAPSPPAAGFSCVRHFSPVGSTHGTAGKMGQC